MVTLPENRCFSPLSGAENEPASFSTPHRHHFQEFLSDEEETHEDELREVLSTLQHPRVPLTLFRFGVCSYPTLFLQQLDPQRQLNTLGDASVLKRWVTLFDLGEQFLPELEPTEFRVEVAGAPDTSQGRPETEGCRGESCGTRWMPFSEGSFKTPRDDDLLYR